MSGPARPPAWLEAYQARFSAMLRTPLERASGTLRAQHDGYPSELRAEALPSARLSAAERLAIYNRQYWLRLFTALQQEYRLTAELLGAWTFNALAAQFLEAHPPREHDLARAADGFPSFLEQALPEGGIELERERRAVPARALVQAARIDDAYRSVLRAPEQPVFAPSARDAARLERARLVPSRAARRVEEDWPLLALRERARDGERAVALPEPHPAPRAWMICRAIEGLRAVPLEPLEAQLMRLLEELPLDRALAALERAAPAAERAELPERARRWLAEGVRHGYWTGIAP